MSVEFSRRHIGPGQQQIDEMLSELGYDSLDALTQAAVPGTILSDHELAFGEAWDEQQLLIRLRQMGARNQVAKSYLGMGYHDCVTPPVIQRNILENPAWYTQYTPYQSEIAQGRLEALLNFQTVIIDLTGLPLANSSLLDEATAAAEAMAMLQAAQGRRGKAHSFFVDADAHPQTQAVVRTRARWRGWELVATTIKHGTLAASVVATPLYLPMMIVPLGLSVLALQALAEVLKLFVPSDEQGQAKWIIR